jgi:cysteinyl-tRNA synthetase
MWQAWQPGEPYWESPWGRGRPGWHIECTAMSMRYLGETIDIHGGGSDLIYPHHECEIAQAQHFSGTQPFTRFWMHIGMVEYQGEKMSKSLGNLVLARDVLHYHTPDALRLYLHSHHYREPWEYIDGGAARYEGLASLLKEAVHVANPGGGDAVDPAPYTDRMRAALDDDLNTPEAVVVLEDMSTAIVRAAGNKGEIAAAQEELRILARLLGVMAWRG